MGAIPAEMKAGEARELARLGADELDMVIHFGRVKNEDWAGVREEIGPVAAFKRACVVQRLPKTRSGKVLRGTMRKIADAEPYRIPATIDDPTILEELRAALLALGYAR